MIPWKEMGWGRAEWERQERTKENPRASKAMARPRRVERERVDGMGQVGGVVGRLCRDGQMGTGGSRSRYLLLSVETREMDCTAEVDRRSSVIELGAASGWYGTGLTPGSRARAQTPVLLPCCGSSCRHTSSIFFLLFSH